MRLDFNVLWVDDQPDRVDSQIKRISRHMEQHGFEFKPTLCKAIKDVHDLITGDVFTDEYDLILVDFDLGGGVQGQQAITEIRERIQYKDVVFYSGQTTPEELRKLAFGASLEGVYCASRDGLVDEVIGVFESLVKKVLDLDHTRGIVMGATTDIDEMVNECLSSIHSKLDQAGQQEMVKEAIAFITERVADLTERLQELQKATSMATLFDSHMIFTANDRLRILTRSLDKEIFKTHKGSRPAVVAYMQEVVPFRNILGHQSLDPDSKPRTVTDNKGNKITVEQTRELRRRILNLRDEFRKLRAALQGN